MPRGCTRGSGPGKARVRETATHIRELDGDLRSGVAALSRWREELTASSIDMLDGEKR